MDRQQPTDKEQIDDDGEFVLVDDYQSGEYRGFLLVQHVEHGLLLLHCTRKKNKGPHWQLPGGRIDETEFRVAAGKSIHSKHH